MIYKPSIINEILLKSPPEWLPDLFNILKKEQDRWANEEYSLKEIKLLASAKTLGKQTGETLDAIYKKIIIG